MLGDFLLNSPADPTGRMIQEAMKDYFALEAEHEVGTDIYRRMFGNSDEDESRKLDIALKRRQLQMLGPQDTQEYNATSADKVLGALGITWAKDLQPPAARSGIAPAQDSGFLTKFKAFGKGAIEPAQELGHGSSSALDLILSNGLSSSDILAKRGPSFGSRFASLLRGA